ncbi:MAG TPA: glycoside hydrolase family 2 TIM barrel-domain containing protein [Cellvibrio sp.]|nr:glycoside hydrolase family 2 TIM barrel-domain containing protein [Cellvibrio sp.]
MLNNRLLASIIFLCAFIVPSVHADPAMQNPDARTALSLDGRWDIIIDPNEKGFYNERYEESETGYFNNAKPSNNGDLIEYDFAHSGKLNVPGDWNTQDAKLFLYEGTLWYHRDFDIGKKTEQQYNIYFGAVNYRAHVYINGKKVGSHEGGFTPFQFPINDFIKSGVNSLVVKVDNHRARDHVTTLANGWWNYGGITRSVKIIQTPKAHIQDYSLQLSNGEADTIEGWISVEGLDKSTEHPQAEIRIPELNITHKVNLNKNGKGEFSIPTKLQPWSPESPKLYTVDLSYQQDLLRDKIGFRKITIEGEDILLNDKSIFLKGISLHEESPLHEGRAWSEEDARAILSQAKELGCNFVRLAHYPHSETLVRMADKMGLMLWSEIPLSRSVLFNNPAVYDKAENQLTEMIARDKNRAAIILWSLGSNTANTSARLKFISELVQKAHELDSSRPITATVEVEVDSKGVHLIDDPLAAALDIISINHYCGWNQGAPGSCVNVKWLSRYHKPALLSEFGAQALQGNHGDKGQRWSEDYQAFVYASNLTMADNISFLRGLTPLALRDFRSPESGLSDVQDFWNRSGLISERGIKKKAWGVLHDYYSRKNPPLEKQENSK